MVAQSGKESSNEFDVRAFLRDLTARPGVYRMLSADSEVIYVGKAGNLKKRVASYFRERHGSAKTAAMMKQVARVEVTITNTEAEALLLEYNQIKQFKPRFNILLRDDKSFPYLHIGSDHEFPRLSFYRGSTRKPGRFFGPYPSAHAVRNADLLQKLFRIRPCEDSFYANRSRPCLQYQIERCSAPCVGLIDKDDYAADIDDAVKFLEGKNKLILSIALQRGWRRRQINSSSNPPRVIATRSLRSSALINASTYPVRVATRMCWQSRSGPDCIASR